MKFNTIKEQITAFPPDCIKKLKDVKLGITTDSNAALVTFQNETNKDKQILLYNNKEGVVISGPFKVDRVDYPKGHRFKWICVNDNINFDMGPVVAPSDPPTPDPPTPVPSSTATTDPSASTEDCTPFDDKTEANQFRTWVNEKLPNIANNIPNLASSITDKKLTKPRSGLNLKCNSDQIKAAARYEIDGSTLLQYFRSNKVPSIKEKPKEVVELEKLHNEGKITGGMYIIKAQGKWAYMKKITSDGEYPNKDHYMLLYPDKTFDTFIDGVGWWLEGKWEPEEKPVKAFVPIKIIESKNMKEQKIITKEPSAMKKSTVTKAVENPKPLDTSSKTENQNQTVPDNKTETKTNPIINDLYNNFLNGRSIDKEKNKIPKVDEFKKPGLFNPKDESKFDSKKFYETQSGLKNYCVMLTKKTFEAFEKKYDLEDVTQKKTIIEVLSRCKQHFRFGGRINGMIDRLIYDKSLGLRENKINEGKNMKISLTNTIRKHLIETIENKREQKVQSRIIKSKLNEIDYRGKSPREVSKFLLEYSKFLNGKGFNNRVLGENLMDLIDALYKEKSGDIKSTFNSEAAKFISDGLKLTSDSSLRIIIKDLFTSKEVEETVKLFNDCEYLSDMICDKISNSMGFEDSSIKNSFSRSLKSEVKSIMCPILQKMGDKMEEKFKDMKSKALS